MPPHFFRAIRAGLFYRKVLGELRGLREELLAQNILLARLVDHLAPLPPRHTEDADADPRAADLEALRELRAVYVNPYEMADLVEYAQAVKEATGREPTEEEMLTHLSESYTSALHMRLESERGPR